MKLTVSQIAEAVGGELIGGERDDVVTGVSTDSRTIKKGDLNVSRNTGSAPKIVENNTGGDRLSCRMNTLFSASGNTGWDRMLGQCA